MSFMNASTIVTELIMRMNVIRLTNASGRFICPEPGNALKNTVWVRPVVGAKPNRTIAYQESPESEGITHQEIPHHQLP
jgi:hypothetical protein